MMIMLIVGCGGCIPKGRWKDVWKVSLIYREYKDNKIGQCLGLNEHNHFLDISYYPTSYLLMISALEANIILNLVHHSRICCARLNLFHTFVLALKLDAVMEYIKTEIDPELDCAEVVSDNRHK